MGRAAPLPWHTPARPDGLAPAPCARFLTGVGLQFGAHDEAVMNTFRTAWDPLILPLLSTHMALTFLSAGLERLAKPAEEG